MKNNIIAIFIIAFVGCTQEKTSQFAHKGLLHLGYSTSATHFSSFNLKIEALALISPSGETQPVNIQHPHINLARLQQSHLTSTDFPVGYYSKIQIRLSLLDTNPKIFSSSQKKWVTPQLLNHEYLSIPSQQIFFHITINLEQPIVIKENQHNLYKLHFLNDEMLTVANTDTVKNYVHFHPSVTIEEVDQLNIDATIDALTRQTAVITTHSNQIPIATGQLSLNSVPFNPVNLDLTLFRDSEATITLTKSDNEYGVTGKINIHTTTSHHGMLIMTAEGLALTGLLKRNSNETNNITRTTTIDWTKKNIIYAKEMQGITSDQLLPGQQVDFHQSQDTNDISLYMTTLIAEVIASNEVLRVNPIVINGKAAEAFYSGSLRLKLSKNMTFKSGEQVIFSGYFLKKEGADFHAFEARPLNETSIKLSIDLNPFNESILMHEQDSLGNRTLFFIDSFDDVNIQAFTLNTGLAHNISMKQLILLPTSDYQLKYMSGDDELVQSYKRFEPFNRALQPLLTQQKFYKIHAIGRFNENRFEVSKFTLSLQNSYLMKKNPYPLDSLVNIKDLIKEDQEKVKLNKALITTEYNKTVRSENILSGNRLSGPFSNLLSSLFSSKEIQIDTKAQLLVDFDNSNKKASGVILDKNPIDGTTIIHRNDGKESVMFGSNKIELVDNLDFDVLQTVSINEKEILSLGDTPRRYILENNVWVVDSKDIIWSSEANIEVEIDIAGFNSIEYLKYKTVIIDGKMIVAVKPTSDTQDINKNTLYFEITEHTQNNWKKHVQEMLKITLENDMGGIAKKQYFGHIDMSDSSNNYLNTTNKIANKTKVTRLINQDGDPPTFNETVNIATDLDRFTETSGRDIPFGPPPPYETEGSNKLATIIYRPFTEDNDQLAQLVKGRDDIRILILEDAGGELITLYRKPNSNEFERIIDLNSFKDSMDQANATLNIEIMSRAHMNENAIKSMATISARLANAFNVENDVKMLNYSKKVESLRHSYDKNLNEALEKHQTEKTNLETEKTTLDEEMLKLKNENRAHSKLIDKQNIDISKLFIQRKEDELTLEYLQKEKTKVEEKIKSQQKEIDKQTYALESAENDKIEIFQKSFSSLVENMQEFDKNSSYEALRSLGVVTSEAEYNSYMMEVIKQQGSTGNDILYNELLLDEKKLPSTRRRAGGGYK